uniref:Uncharacterized protein n=1 Tax=Pseudomonas phage Nican01 TaxID=3138540 RepID=A0AAU6W0T6_9CAUD
MKLQAVEVEEMTVEQCWAEIEAVGELMSVPGAMQAALKKDPTIGAEFNANAKEILHIIVDNFDAGISPGKSPEDRKLVEHLNQLFLQNQLIQQRWNVKVLTRASMAMQQLPINLMILEVMDVTASEKEGLTEEHVSELKKLETEHQQSGLAKIDNRIMNIMQAGIAAAGGQAEFAKLQYEVAQSLPEQFSMTAELKFTSQMIGAVMTAIDRRAQTADFTLAQIRTTIEMGIAAKQALSLSNIVAYGYGHETLIHTVAHSAEYHVLQAMSDINGTPAAPEQPKKPVAAEATHIAEKKPGSFNFEGNRTIN